MSVEETYPAWILVGATAVGKSSVAHAAARREGYRILSADSMLVYRGLDLGTAKPSAAERRDVHYDGLDLVAPSENFSTGDYVAHAREAFRAAAAAGARMLVAGGTGLYVRALLSGFAAAGAVDPERRLDWEARAREEGVAVLWEELQRLWPEHARQVTDPQNPRRVIRALELAESGQRPERWHAPAAQDMVVGLERERRSLTERIERRIDRMFAEGLEAEVRELLSGPPLSRTAAQAIGYQEVIAWIRGECSFETVRERMLVRTRRLAKRQRTWFRHQARVAWVDVSPGEPVASLVERVSAQWRQHGPATVRFRP